MHPAFAEHRLDPQQHKNRGNRKLEGGRGLWPADLPLSLPFSALGYTEVVSAVWYFPLRKNMGQKEAL